MSIKIECDKCGFKNDLGRVFCSQCGKKLSLERTSLDDLRQQEELDVGLIVKRIVIGVVLTALAAVLVLAFWPTAAPAVLTDPVGAKQVPMKTKMIVRAMRSKQKMSFTFTEAELNGFLASRAQSRQVQALAIDIREGSFELYGRFRLGFSTNVSFLAGVQAPFSCTLTGAFAQGRLNVVKSRVGHLPMAGPLEAIPLSCFESVLNDVVAEPSVVDNVSDVALSGDAAMVKFGK